MSPPVMLQNGVYAEIRMPAHPVEDPGLYSRLYKAMRCDVKSLDLAVQTFIVDGGTISYIPPASHNHTLVDISIKDFESKGQLATVSLPPTSVSSTAAPSDLIAEEYDGAKVGETVLLDPDFIQRYKKWLLYNWFGSSDYEQQAEQIIDRLCSGFTVESLQHDLVLGQLITTTDGLLVPRRFLLWGLPF